MKEVESDDKNEKRQNLKLTDFLGFQYSEESAHKNMEYLEDLKEK